MAISRGAKEVTIFEHGPYWTKFKFRSTNFIGIIGIIFIFTGILFSIYNNVLGSIIIGIGTSTFSAVIVTKIVTPDVGAIPVSNIIEALSEKTKFIRTEQTAVLTFKICGDYIKVEKRHEYKLKNPRDRDLYHTVSMYTDKSPDESLPSVGLTYISGSDEKTFNSDELENGGFIKKIDGKWVFNREYLIRHRNDNKFVFCSTQYYRLTDRLIWTIEELSRDFKVTIFNLTDNKDPFYIKINHHQEKIIRGKIKSIGIEGNKEFRFDSEILPYQGFEIMWDLAQSSAESETILTELENIN